MAPPNESPEQPLYGTERVKRKLQQGLADMLPHLEELKGRERTPEEREFLSDMERLKGRVPTPQEENIAIAQARMIGNL